MAATRKKCPWLVLLGSNWNGSQISASGSETKSRPSTPTIVYGSPPSERALPMTVGIAAELALPQAVAQHHHVAAVGRVFLRREGAAQHHRRAEDAEVGFADVNAVDQLRPVAGDVESRAGEVVGGHVLEDAGLLPPDHELGNGGDRDASLRQVSSAAGQCDRHRDKSSGFSSTAFTTEKMAVLAPMPSASAETAAMREARTLEKQMQRMLDVFPEISHGSAPNRKWNASESVELRSALWQDTGWHTFVLLSRRVASRTSYPHCA